jgi:catechol 2,3-dioxygenase-like lactoylglutathione lyase family enzyme
MFTLPRPKLGKVTAITISSPDLEASLKFYEKLGFKEVARMDVPVPWIHISDGALLIMIRKDNQPYIALTYYTENIGSVAAELEAGGIEFKEKPGSADYVKRYIIKSPDGTSISLVYVPNNNFEQPPGPTMLTMPQEDYMKPDTYVNKSIGMWGEFAESVKDLEASLKFWEKLGFVALSKYEQPQPWAILTDGIAIVGLHQTNEWSGYPVMTFFAADMKDKLTKLQETGLEIYKDFGGGNVVVKTPENQYLNLFNMSM